MDIGQCMLFCELQRDAHAQTGCRSLVFTAQLDKVATTQTVSAERAA